MCFEIQYVNDVDQNASCRQKQFLDELDLVVEELLYKNSTIWATLKIEIDDQFEHEVRKQISEIDDFVKFKMDAEQEASGLRVDGG